MNPLDIQIGGFHYKHFKIQPIEFAMANNLNACQAAILKYIMRDKGTNIEDLEKAKHCIDILIDWEKKKDERIHSNSNGTRVDCNCKCLYGASKENSRSALAESSTTSAKPTYPGSWYRTPL